MAAKEKMLYGEGGDVKSQLSRLREDLTLEAYRRLLPGYTRQYLQAACALVDLESDGDMDRCFSLIPKKKGAIEPLLCALESYDPQSNQCAIQRTCSTVTSTNATARSSGQTTRAGL